MKCMFVSRFSSPVNKLSLNQLLLDVSKRCKLWKQYFSKWQHIRSILNFHYTIFLGILWIFIWIKNSYSLPLTTWKAFSSGDNNRTHFGHPQNCMVYRIRALGIETGRKFGSRLWPGRTPDYLLTAFAPRRPDPTFHSILRMPEKVQNLSIATSNLLWNKISEWTLINHSYCYTQRFEEDLWNNEPVHFIRILRQICVWEALSRKFDIHWMVSMYMDGIIIPV